MSSMIERLVEALTHEFANEVVFQPFMPATLTIPSVVVSPGDPFLIPATHGMVEERWDVLVAVAMKDGGSGILQMRDLSLRVLRATVSVGGIWREASGPRRLTDDRQSVVSSNTISFRYQPPTI